ncbi:MAG: putative hydro-lyase [Planctomycetes bacterium]|nr:putative hydro-lyase [Planctomycetota bacterium]
MRSLGDGTGCGTGGRLGRPGMTARGWPECSGREIRAACRAGAFDGPTAGAARGFAQVNVVILPACDAGDFAEFCRRNPKPCPVLEVTSPGRVEPVRLAPGADLRTDLPRYRVLRQGRCVDRPKDILSVWRDDFVAFLIGCSFTFETALLEAGVPVRHIEEQRNVPMYRTGVACTPAGAFAGPLVVSMRPMNPEHVEVARRVTAAVPRVHGAPVYVGDPTALGIADLARPDYGEAVTVRPGEVPVFWACGVTPMEAILRARPEIAVTHEPGHMLVTDVRDIDLREPINET